MRRRPASVSSRRRLRIRLVERHVDDDPGRHPGLQRRADSGVPAEIAGSPFATTFSERAVGAPERELPVRQLVRRARAGDRSDDPRGARALRFAAQPARIGQPGRRHRRRSARAVLYASSNLGTVTAYRSTRDRRVRTGRRLAVQLFRGCRTRWRSIPPGASPTSETTTPTRFRRSRSSARAASCNRSATP